MFEGFTGYLLPYDQTAYWATVVGMNITANGPFVGTILAQVMQGGPAIGSDSLSRFYSLHMLVAPGAIFALIGLHLYLVIRLGVSSPPWSKEAAGADYNEPDPMITKPSASLQARRAQHARYKEDVKKKGKPFYPYAMFHDTVMSLVVVSVIVALASIWKWTSFGPHHDGLDQGLLGPE